MMDFLSSALQRGVSNSYITKVTTSLLIRQQLVVGPTFLVAHSVLCSLWLLVVLHSTVSLQKHPFVICSLCAGFTSCRGSPAQGDAERQFQSATKCCLSSWVLFMFCTEKGSADRLATEHIQLGRYGFTLFDSVLCRQLKHLGCLLCSYYLNNLLHFSCQLLHIANIFRKFCGLFPVVFNSEKFFVLRGGIK